MNSMDILQLGMCWYKNSGLLLIIILKLWSITDEWYILKFYKNLKKNICNIYLQLWLPEL